jgi:anthranilate phosphoribosyltransferase
MDEISVSAPTSVCEVKNGSFRSYVIEPEQFGIERSCKSAVTGGTPEENARITRAVLEGEKGAHRDAVIINSAAALYVAGRCASIGEGVLLTAELIDSGKAKEQLEKLVRLSNL